MADKDREINMNVWHVRSDNGGNSAHVASNICGYLTNNVDSETFLSLMTQLPQGEGAKKNIKKLTNVSFALHTYILHKN